jgi:hypothetical protein
MLCSEYAIGSRFIDPTHNLASFELQIATAKGI